MVNLFIQKVQSSRAEINPKKKKLLLLDTGIFQRLLQLNIGELISETDFEAINKGAIAEQYTGLELLKVASCYRQETLFYWQREARNSSAEVDYIVQKSGQIVPLEIKSRRKGAMRSMHIFLGEKKSPYGVRFSMENFAKYENILVIPLYAVGDWYSNRN